MKSYVLAVMTALMGSMLGLGGITSKQEQIAAKYESQQGQPSYEAEATKETYSSDASLTYRVDKLEEQVSDLKSKIETMRSNPQAAAGVADVKSTTVAVDPKTEMQKRVEQYKTEIAKIEEASRKEYQAKLDSLSTEIKAMSPSDILKALAGAGYQATYSRPLNASESGGSSGSQSVATDYAAVPMLPTYQQSSYYSSPVKSAATYRTGLFGRTYYSGSVSSAPTCRVVNGQVICN